VPRGVAVHEVEHVVALQVRPFVQGLLQHGKGTILLNIFLIKGAEILKQVEKKRNNKIKISENYLKIFFFFFRKHFKHYNITMGNIPVSIFVFQTFTRFDQKI
jgi:hypothetical protein